MSKQLESLISENEELKKRIQTLEEENKYLWYLVEEERNAQQSVGQALQNMLQEAIEDELVKKMKPIGDA
jgi:hypothetical protein